MAAARHVHRLHVMAELPGDRLRQDHARLDALFGELLEQLDEGNFRSVRTAWSQLEDGLRAHLEAEERFVLPLFEEVDLRETLQLRAEHVTIRAMLAELGVGIDLHLVQRDLARTFIAGLRAHARREEELLYRWANRRLQQFALLPVRNPGRTDSRAIKRQQL